jgi:tRNA 2-(methylsulfanyl)-N6-isopentenyladenosine37 hydroxylase
LPKLNVTELKLSIDLVSPTPASWSEAVKADFDSFLQDHANCERKASGMSMGLVSKYPNRKEIIPMLIETALEELEHFQQVHQIMEKRGVPLKQEMEKDPYIHALMQHLRGPSDQRFMDYLLMVSIIEVRGCERFKLVSEIIEDEDLKKFYKHLWTTEAKHGHIFVKMALEYFPEAEVYDRLRELNEIESKIVLSLPPRAALH